MTRMACAYPIVRKLLSDYTSLTPEFPPEVVRERKQVIDRAWLPVVSQIEGLKKCPACWVIGMPDNHTLGLCLSKYTIYELAQDLNENLSVRVRKIIVYTTSSTVMRCSTGFRSGQSSRRSTHRFADRSDILRCI